MKRIIVLAFLFLTATTLHAEAIRGAWTATLREDQKLQLSMTRENSNFGAPFLLSAFNGLAPAQISATSDTKATFVMAREAGTIAFDGWFRNGEGAGHFAFTPQPRFLDTLRSMGVRTDDSDYKSDDERLFRLALHDVSTDFIRSMRAAGYDVSLREYTRMRIFNVNPSLIAELRELGFDHVSSDDVIRMQIHGATPRYIRDMRQAGMGDLSIEQLVRSRIHGATPEFAAAMAKLGYRDLPFDDLVRFRIHGVSPEFVTELRALGYDRIPADQLVRMRIHGVTPEYIHDLQRAGYSNVPVEKLVQMRIHGLDASLIKGMTSQ